MTIEYGLYGSGEFAAECLSLLSSFKRPRWAVSGAPRPSGRGRRLTRMPAALRAEELDITLIESDDASHDPKVIELARELRTDMDLVVDIGQMIRPPLLRYEDHVGCINIHPSSLPRYRGAAPIQRALMSGERRIGATVFKLTHAMDAGPILFTETLDVGDLCYGDLLRETARIACTKLIELMRIGELDAWSFTPQDDSAATYANKISPAEERIDWTMPADKIRGLIKAMSPRPGAWSTFADRRIRILDARDLQTSASSVPGTADLSGKFPTVSAGVGSVELLTIQPEGKRPYNAVDWKNGLRQETEVRFI